MTNEEFIKSISLEGEEWRDVVGYECRYIVSSLGRIVSLGHIIHGQYDRMSKAILMKPHITKHGYCHVDLFKGTHSSRKVKKLHRVVAEAFIDNPHNLPEIDHIDTDRTNNSVSNLRWCTPKSNSENPISRKKKSDAHTGVLNQSSSKAIVALDNGVLVHTFLSFAEAERNGFSKGGIQNQIKGLYSHHHGLQWMYLSDYEASINKSKNA